MADSTPLGGLLDRAAQILELVDEPAFTLLGSFPATPAGHVAFLEFVRDEVRYAADAKRQQLEREYPNATIESMVGGIKWAEGSKRVSALADLPADTVEQVARVFRWELTPGTVEQIDELLTPVVRALREAWENRDTPSGAGESSERDFNRNLRAATLAANAAAPASRATRPPDTKVAKSDGDTSTPTKGKRSTERGEGRAKLIAALTKHHKYADGSCLNLEPVGNNELARLAEVSQSTASAFFSKHFHGHAKYRATCCDPTRLVAALKLLNQEFSPHLLLGAKPSGEDEQ